MDNLRSKYEEQCRELNMDRDTEENAWRKFTEVSQRFVLDGDETHWFCCALYASCRESFTPTVGNALVMGNCVSLTKLLRCCNISIYEFLSKVKKWHDMANLTEDFKKQIQILERNFSLTYLLCQHYTKFFQVIFLNTNADRKSTKFRSVSKCSYQKLCDFAWCLFLCAKNECTSEELDMQTLFYLLICCIDLIYKNVLYEQRIDLINPKFKGAPPQEQLITQKTDELPCIIEELSALANGVAAKDAKNFKDTKWQSILTQLFDANTLHGNRQTLLEIIANNNFERSWKSLNAAYEQYILGIGAFDERILLNNPSVQCFNAIESSSAGANENCGVGGGDDYSKSILSLSPEQSQKLYVPPDLDAAGGGDKLKKLLEVTLSAQPIGILCNVSDAILQRINNKLDEMLAELRMKLGNKSHGKDIIGLIKPLYYHLLEKIVRVEVNNKPHINTETLLDTDAFNTTLFVCCVEIVLDAYDCELEFPWTLDCFNIDGFMFSKIIELVVARHDNILNRLHVKHLNYIEECCLESLSWRSTSEIWNILKALGTSGVPAWVDVDKNSSSVSNKDNTLLLGGLQTPTPATTNNHVPPTTTSSETARKDLFNAAAAKANADETANAPAAAPPSNEVRDQQTPAASHCRKIASLSIFLRKFYKLAWFRLKELCNELNMQHDAYVSKIWTLFEYSITQRTHLLRNRHLDQLIMCAIYIYIRVAEVESNKFTDIMKAYRKQPQAVSTTYREVLIQYAGGGGEGETGAPEYNDLIFFYNKIYVPEMTPYALDFSKKRGGARNSKLLMSPHPAERQSLPKKILNNHKIFVSPMEKSDLQLSPDPLIYGIGKSPAKELQMMNDVVRRGKRNLPFNDDNYGGGPEPKYAPAHLSSVAVVMKDRRAESFLT